MSGSVYMDYAATAPLLGVSARAMMPFMEESGSSCALNANPNSLHTPGREAFAALEDCRRRCANVLGVRPNEIVFTGCATESDSSALFGIVAAWRKQHPGETPHVVTSSVEHDAVRKPAEMLRSLGLASVTFVDPVPTGHVRTEDVAAAMHSDTALVSVIGVHNETGAVNDIWEIGKAAHQAGALFHTDAVQMLGKVDIDLSSAPVDMASFAAHKIGGPKGVGMLYVKQGTPYSAWLAGGGQESGMRSGTQNVCGIAGFTAALEHACEPSFMERENGRLVALRDRLYEGLCSISGVRASVPCTKGSKDYAPHIVNVFADGVESETMVLQLDLVGIAASGGSACSSHSLGPSNSLVKIGLSKDQAQCSLRLSIGSGTTEDDVERCIQEVDRIISKFLR